MRPGRIGPRGAGGRTGPAGLGPSPPGGRRGPGGGAGRGAGGTGGGTLITGGATGPRAPGQGAGALFGGPTGATTSVSPAGVGESFKRLGCTRNQMPRASTTATSRAAHAPPMPRTRYKGCSPPSAGARRRRRGAHGPKSSPAGPPRCTGTVACAQGTGLACCDPPIRAGDPTAGGWPAGGGTTWAVTMTSGRARMPVFEGWSSAWQTTTPPEGAVGLPIRNWVPQVKQRAALLRDTSG